MNTVEIWFGDKFTELHPLLQKLHRNGGVLSGTVNVEFGSGLAGLFGNRLAGKLGVPVQPGCHDMTVKIESRNDGLLWSRDFGNGNEMVSIFKPEGSYPEGFWVESSGFIRLMLGVDMRDGGWYWVQRGAKIGSINLPLWLMPRSHAYKCISEDKYKFSVTLKLPIFGLAFSYSGMLNLDEPSV